MSTIARWFPWSVLLLVFVAPLNSDAWVVAPEYGYGASVATTASGGIVSGGQTVGTENLVVRLQSGADGADVWRYELDGSAPDIPGSYNDYAADVAIDGNGDVLAGGASRNTTTALDLQIVKLGGADGAPIWTQTLDSPNHGNDAYIQMALHPGGDVVVTGDLATGPSSAYTYTVARLAGATGAVVWQHDIVGPLPDSVAGGVKLDGAGDVLTAGSLTTSSSEHDAVAVKLDGATGAELWRTVIDGGNGLGSDAAHTVAVDAAGDLVMGGRFETTGGDGFTVFKLSGTSGGVLWRYDSISDDFADFCSALAIDPAGDVYASGSFDHKIGTVKLDGTTGARLWRIRHRSSSGFYVSLAIAPDGNLLMNGQYSYRFDLEKIAASTGRKMWRRRLRGNSYNGGYSAASAVDPSGRIVAVGAHVSPLPRGHVNGPESYTVIKVCAANGDPVDADPCP